MNIDNKIKSNLQQNEICQEDLPSVTRRLIRVLIALAILVNCLGMFFPALSSTFTPYYGSIAKNIVDSGNWSNLMLIGQDWMDKPHFPFWITAVSYKIFGVTSYSYIIPGFIFHLIGVLYTYKLAKLWYNKDVGLIAALMYVTSLHLMMSAVDVRAEAYLLGEIIPACYYWVLYDKQVKLRYLLFGAIFTALAIMTKGIFVIITIISGLVVLWIIQGRLRNLISLKWIGALFLSILFVTPELIALYCQFDAHPEKIVFGQTHVSGIKWFFWDSQFGRFFNTGPIMSTNPPPFHYLYFVHTFLWAFLPWWPIFFIAIWSVIKNALQNRKSSDANIYLLASFFITFLLFSITTFQVDHYTNIIFPFACIICAAWLVNCYSSLLCYTRVPFDTSLSCHTSEGWYPNPAQTVVKKKPQILYHFAYIIELIITLVLLLGGIAISVFILTGVAKIVVYILIGIVFIMIFGCRRAENFKKILVYPSLALMVIFICAMCVNGIEYAKYDAGYQIALSLNKQLTQQINQKLQAKDVEPKPHMVVIGYDVDLKSLNLNLNDTYTYRYESDLSKISSLTNPSFLVTKLSNKEIVQKNFPMATIDEQVAGNSIEKFILNTILTGIAIEKNQQNNPELEYYIVFKINQ